jgi:Xaa-Pro aminopeptidase
MSATAMRPSPPKAPSSGRAPQDARPSADDVARWAEADRAARPDRLARLRERMAADGVDAFFAVRRETIRYLTGFVLEDGEEKVAGNSGRALISADEIVVLADSRYTIQAHEEAPDARVEECGYDLAARWPDLVASLGTPGHGGGVRRLATESGALSHAQWMAVQEAAPSVEVIPGDGWVEDMRQVKDPSEIERIAAACRLGDAGLTALLPRIEPGVTEAELAWELETWLRTHGAEALSFPVATLAGERAAMPHGSPTDRAVRRGEVLLFDFGAQVAGYRSDMTRTLFVGEPRDGDRAVYDLVARAQQVALDRLSDVVATGESVTGRSVDAAARQVIDAAGHADHYGHNLGHGIGLATHEKPTLGRSGPELELPSPTVFSVEPGVYLAGDTGVRIEDLVAFDLAERRLRLLTGFPREVTVVGE